MAKYAKANLTDKQKADLRLLKELRRQITLAIEEIDIEGVETDDALAQLVRTIEMERLV